MKMKIKDGNVIGEEGEFEGWDDNLGDAEGQKSVHRAKGDDNQEPSMCVQQGLQGRHFC